MDIYASFDNRKYMYKFLYLQFNKLIMIVDEYLNDCSEIIIRTLDKEKRSLSRTNSILLIMLGFFIGVLIILFNNLTILQKENKNLNSQIQKEEYLLSLEQSIGYWFINKPEEVDDSILYQFLIDNNAWYPDILLKQAKIESGNYSSNIYKSNNNLYGMRKPYKRSTTQSGINKGYGLYQNWCLSVLDRLLWDYYHFDEKPTKEEYLNKLQFFAEDSNYISKII